jgi:hypothetical protein
MFSIISAKREISYNNPVTIRRAPLYCFGFCSSVLAQRWSVRTALDTNLRGISAKYVSTKKTNFHSLGVGLERSHSALDQWRKIVEAIERAGLQRL